MEDGHCVDFLQWALPRLQMEWAGFRKVRRQVCRRIDRRIFELGLESAASYALYLDENPPEWTVLARLCRVTISRFYRDRRLFDYLGSTLLPSFARDGTASGNADIRIWCAGCASGEEPYTIGLIYHLMVRPRLPDSRLDIVATDIDPVMIERAAASFYRASSLRDLPEALLEQGFEPTGEGFALKRQIKDYVSFLNQDIRERSPEGPFDMILCRNLVFTYFDRTLQFSVAQQLQDRLHDRGMLIIGTREKLPAGAGFIACSRLPVYRKKHT
jgi:chemotaxis protein methyltransferase CheR